MTRSGDTNPRVVARVMIMMVKVYQVTLSSVMGRGCRHLPTCSSYTIEAIARHGAWRGFWLGVSRIVRCNPWGSSGFDPVPDVLTPQGWKFWRYGRWHKKKDDGM